MPSPQRTEVMEIEGAVKKPQVNFTENRNSYF